MASSILMFMALCCCYSLAYGGDENGFVVVPSSYFEPDETAVVCSNARVNLEQNHSRLWLPLANRHGPCAPRKSSSRRPSLAEMLRRSRARSRYIRSRASRGTGSEQDNQEKVAVPIPTHIGDFVDSVEYVVTLGLGTPAVQQTVLLDTGSGLSWVQCKPWCKPGECASQKHPLFDPTRSSTFSPIRCHSALCRQLPHVLPYSNNGCTNGTENDLCRFHVPYEDGSRTAGVYVSDRLTLTSTRVDTVDNFRFGCGHDHRANKNERYDGLLALNRQSTSLLAQTSSVYHGAFSYCLPAENSRSGFLALGTRRSATSTEFVFTPLRTISEAELGFYEVLMTGIVVSGKRLNLPPSAFAAGILIDSASFLTHLQSTAYRALRAAFREAMAAYPLLPHGPHGATCFNLTGHKNVVVPKVALTFSGGATINLDAPNGILVEGCLAFEDAGGGDNILGLLGNVNQRNFEVLYDSRNNKVGFRPNAC